MLFPMLMVLRILSVFLILAILWAYTLPRTQHRGLAWLLQQIGPSGNTSRLNFAKVIIYASVLGIIFNLQYMSPQILTIVIGIDALVLLVCTRWHHLLVPSEVTTRK